MYVYFNLLLAKILDKKSHSAARSKAAASFLSVLHVFCELLDVFGAGVSKEAQLFVEEERL